MAQNCAISLKQIFNRIIYRFCNRQYFGVQKAKNGDRGTIVYSVALLLVIIFKENMNASKPSDQSKGLGGNIDCRDKNLYMVLKGFPNVVT